MGAMLRVDSQQEVAILARLESRGNTDIATLCQGKLAKDRACVGEGHISSTLW